MTDGGRALLVVDMQRYFCEPDSTYGRFSRARNPQAAGEYERRLVSVVPAIAMLLDAARHRGDLAVFTKFGSERADGADLPLWARRFNEASRADVGAPVFPPVWDPMSDVIAELAPQSRELVVTKATSGPLAGTTIDSTLRRHGVSTVTVVGVATDVCVLGAARELADADFDVEVIEDACASPLGDAAHRTALASLAATFAAVRRGAD